MAYGRNPRRGWKLPALCLGLLAIAAAVAVPLAVSGSSAPPRIDRGLHVIPFPGTPDAAPDSQVIFSSLARPELRSVTVGGSRSGPHQGRLITLPAGGGTAFVPARPFLPGEEVRVQANLSSASAGTASGMPGAARLKFSFGVADPPAPATANPGPPPAKKSSTRAITQGFHSEPGLTPPAVRASANPDTRSGDVFLTPNNAPENGPMILDSQGKLVWFRPLRGQDAAFDLQVERYRDQPVLTYWVGRVVTGGYGADGRDVILDRTYRTLAVLRAGHGYSSDLHEFQLTRRGTAWIDAYVPVKTNLTSVGGPAHGTALDCVIQELDIKTGQVLWEWHALGHIPIGDSLRGKPTKNRPYDYFHLNSIQQLPNGNLLISARNTWAIYEIDRRTGKIMWTLGGPHSDFKMGDGTRFEWQHDAHLSGRTLTLFDDAWDGVRHHQREPESSGLVLRIDTRAMTAALINRYYHPKPLIASSEGSMQILPRRRVFISWGSEPDLGEYLPDGRQIWNASLPLGIDTYRAYRFPWDGQPLGRPSLAVGRPNGGPLTAFASWDGATQVVYWRVLAGRNPGTLSRVRQVRRQGFETAVGLPARARYVAIQAIGRRGTVLGTSRIRSAPSH